MLAEIFMLRLEALSRSLKGLAGTDTRFEPIVLPAGVVSDAKTQTTASSEYPLMTDRLAGP